MIQLFVRVWGNLNFQLPKVAPISKAYITITCSPMTSANITTMRLIPIFNYTNMFPPNYPLKTFRGINFNLT